MDEKQSTVNLLEALVSLERIITGQLDHTGGSGHAGSPAALEERSPEDVDHQRPTTRCGRPTLEASHTGRKTTCACVMFSPIDAGHSR